MENTASGKITTWLNCSIREIRTAFFEEPHDRSHASALIQPKPGQSSRDVLELAAICTVLFAAGLATVWSTTL